MRAVIILPLLAAVAFATATAAGPYSLEATSALSEDISVLPYSETCTGHDCTLSSTAVPVFKYVDPTATADGMTKHDAYSVDGVDRVPSEDFEDQIYEDSIPSVSAMSTLSGDEEEPATSFRFAKDVYSVDDYEEELSEPFPFEKDMHSIDPDGDKEESDNSATLAMAMHSLEDNEDVRKVSAPTAATFAEAMAAPNDSFLGKIPIRICRQEEECMETTLNPTTTPTFKMTNESKKGNETSAQKPEMPAYEGIAAAVRASAFGAVIAAVAVGVLGVF